MTIGTVIAATLGLAAAAAYLRRTSLRPKHTEALQTNLHDQGDACSLVSYWYMLLLRVTCLRLSLHLLMQS